MVSDINPSGNAFPYLLTNVGGKLFFIASDGAHGSELWTSDGTAGGTQLVKDINPGKADASATLLTSSGGKLYFSADDGTHGTELWVSDGTSDGTRMVKDLNPGAANSVPSFLTDVNGTLYFAADDGTVGDELWSSDGTAAGTTIVQDIYPYGGSFPYFLTNVNGTLFFNGVDLDHGAELWAAKPAALTSPTYPVMALGAGSGWTPLVNVLRGGQPMLSFYAFDPSFQGGVDVAVGDVNGDGVADIIAGAGAGGASHVRIFSGVDGSQIAGPLGSFLAFPGAGGDAADPASSYYTTAFNGPIHVAAGDVNGDGHADVIVSVGADGPPQVKIFSGADGSLLGSFLAFVDPSHADPSDPAYFTNAFQGGVNVAAGDINADGLDDLIVAAGPGAGPHVKVFADGQSSSVIRSFFAFDPGFNGGVNVASGDLNGDGTDDILTAAGPGSGPNVRAFSGSDGSVLASFFAYDPGYRGGVHLAGGDYDGDGLFDLYTAPVGGTSADVRRFNFNTGRPTTTTQDFFAFDPYFTGGASIALS
jgi:ELWxxDGT repeat protein